jgi:hypothetical protein
MGLLDNLFKSKSDAGGERVAGSSPDEEVERSSEVPSQVDSTPGAVPKPAHFLAPKDYVPRSSVRVVPPVRGQPPPERKPVSSQPGEGLQMAQEIVLTLGDVLSRIPPHFLRQGVPDLHRELRFPAEGLAAEIARGRASVSLTDIVAQCPEIFVTETEGLADVRIRLPLQKLVEQIGITGLAMRAPLQPVAKSSIEATGAAVSDDPLNSPGPVVASPLPPPVLIRAGADSGVPPPVFAELQAADSSETAGLDPDETMSAAPLSLAVAPAAEPDPPAAPSAEQTSSVAPLELDERIAALLGAEAPVHLEKVSQLLAALPGIQACIIAARDRVINGGDLPDGLDPGSIRELGRRMHHALDAQPQVFAAGKVEHLTLGADRFSLSLFTRGDACVCAVHRARVFLPGVRERFAAVADELGRLS